MNAINALAPYVHWLVRLSFAATFLYHGLPKLLDPAMFAAMMSMPTIAIVMIAILEVGGALLVLYGGFGPDWATRIGGIATVPVMLGAIFMVHISNGWDFTKGGVEFNALLLAVGITFFVRGNANMKIAM
mgnify:CR=1 FL=1